MKAVTLTQPWATLVAIGAKSIETRSWRTDYRGVIAIHAAKHFPMDARMLCPTPPFDEALGSETLYTGKVVAVATLSECFQFGARTEAQIRERSKANRLPAFEADFGDYAPGRWGFHLTDVRRIETPVLCRGMLGLWTVPDDVCVEIERQLQAVAA